MKIKLVTVDLELSRRQKLAGAALAMLVVPLGAALAAPPVTFTSGATLTAAQLNQNFEALDTDVAALETTVGDLEQSVTTLEAASHPKSAYRAIRSTAQNIPTNTPTTVTFDTEQFDLGNEGTPASGLFTAAAPGVYQVQCSSHLTAGTSAGPIFSMFILKNGAEVQGEDRQASSGSYLSIVASSLVQLAAGDTVNCAVFHTSGATVSLTPGTRTHFSVARVD